MKFSGKDIRFVLIDNQTNQVVTTQWAGMISQIYGVNLVTIRRMFTKKNGEFHDHIEKDGITTYRCLEYHHKKRNTIFMSGSLILRDRLKNIFKFNEK
jgi:hypothetical protein